jgi:hypothetical protein
MFTNNNPHGFVACMIARGVAHAGYSVTVGILGAAAILQIAWMILAR